MKTMKKLFASLLVLCMVLTLPNMAAYAADEITLGETITTDTSKEGVTGEYQYTVKEEGVYKIELISAESTEETIRIYLPDMDENAQVDSPLEIIAYKDDVLNIQCEAYTMDFETWEKTYGTGKFEWKVTYEGPIPGTSTNPDDIGSIYEQYGEVMLETSALTFGTEATYYYYTYTAEADGELVVWLNNMFNSSSDLPNMDLVVKNGEKVVENEMIPFSMQMPGGMMEGEYPQATLAVKEGDVITIQVGLKALEMAAGFEFGPVYANAAFTAAEGSSLNPRPLEVTDAVDYTEEKPGEVIVPAGTTVYFQGGYDFADKLLIVEGSNFELSVKDRETGKMVAVTVTNGVAEAPTQMVNLGGGNFAAVFAIKNTGSEAAEYKVYCDTIEGTVYAPEVLEDTDTQEFEAGDGTYYYVFTATEDGYIKVQVSSTTEWFFYVENATTEERSENHFSNNDEMEAVAEEYIKVSKDDEIIIAVMPFDVEKGDVIAGKVITTVTYTTPDEATVEGTIGDIEASTTGSKVEIDILDKDGEAVTVVPEEIFAAAKDKDVDLLVKVNALFSWLINGKDITSAKDLDLAISDGPEAVTEEMIKAIAGEGNNAAPFVIAHDGELGLKATLKVQYDPSYADEYANLFYYNPTTKALEFVCVTTIGENGVAEFNFTHASEYVLVVGEDLTPEDPDDTTNPGGGTTTPGGDTTTPDDDKDTIGKLGDLVNPMIYVIVLLGAALVGAGFVAKKRFA